MGLRLFKNETGGVPALQIFKLLVVAMLMWSTRATCDDTGLDLTATGNRNFDEFVGEATTTTTFSVFTVTTAGTVTDPCAESDVVYTSSVDVATTSACWGARPTGIEREFSWVTDCDAAAGTYILTQTGTIPASATTSGTAHTASQTITVILHARTCAADSGIIITETSGLSGSTKTYSPSSSIASIATSWTISSTSGLCSTSDLLFSPSRSDGITSNPSTSMTSDGVFDINSISNSDATGITVTITAYTLGDGTSYSNREVVGTSSEVSFTLNITPSCYYSPKIADSSEFVDAMNWNTGDF